MARKILFPLCFVLALALTSCAPAGQTAAQDDGTTHLVATTYPVYLFTAELVKGVEGITVDLMIDQPISCLHDYTLSVKDMKTLERADLIILSGAGLEETMEDALDTVSDTPQIDCAQGIALLESSHDHDHGHDDDDHDHEEADHDEPSGHDHESDPHIWLDPNRVEQMLDNLAAGLRRFDPTHAALYETNCRLAQEQLKTAYPQMQAALQNLSCRELITSTTALPTSPKPLTWTFYGPSRRRQAARPPPKTSWRSWRRSTIIRSPPSSPRSTARMPPPR